jgi:hypothetical protein
MATEQASPADSKIVRAAIHPSIGVARIGDSAEEFFLAPEVDDPPPITSLKDAAGALKRQAAFFRVYGYNAAGQVVAELTGANADVAWTVHVANKKAAWYQFQIALDIPEAEEAGAVPSQRRNQQISGDERGDLVIDPGPRSISGKSQSGSQYQFDSGLFKGTQVYLGELRTDPVGRLLFLGGRGVSASYDGSPVTTFANNDKWHDDVSDGPVTAEVTIGGESIPVDPAWVVVAPPNYAPNLKGLRTMYDLLFDVYVQAGWLQPPSTVSFKQHVLPLLRRLAELQWVNQGFATKFGFGGREHFLDPGYLKRLASPAKQYEELRQQIWNAFRSWKRDGESPIPWPSIYGDAMSIPPISPRQHMTLTETQMQLLARWAKGEFASDLEQGHEPKGAIEDVPLADQPATLDRAALSFCLADAFHPGCEMTWPVRHLSMYTAPFRFLHREGEEPEISAPVLTPALVEAVDGPLYGQTPGSISRWMAVPWQTDTASCLFAYPMGFDLRYDPFLPTFWPARVPNQVLTQKSYEIVMDESKPPASRQEAFDERAAWLRQLGENHPQAREKMITEFGKLGVVEARPGPADGMFPSTIYVESEDGFEGDVNPRRNLYVLHVPEARDPEVAEEAIAQAVEAAPHPDEEVMAGYFPKVDRFGVEPS